MRFDRQKCNEMEWHATLFAFLQQDFIILNVCDNSGRSLKKNTAFSLPLASRRCNILKRFHAT
jgi:hypothetical protein